MGLTPRQERFVAEYLVDLNATAAARRAGYKDPNIGRQLIAKNNVSEAIRAEKAARSQRTELTQDYVLAKLKAIAELEASDAQDSHLKFSSKLKALELLGKHLGAFTERVEQDATVRIVLSPELEELAQ